MVFTLCSYKVTASLYFRTLMNSTVSHRKYPILFALILAGEAIFFLPFVLPRIFRPTLLEVFDITNLELGTCFSLYGIVAMISYFIGGPLADRFPARNLMSAALLLTATGGFIMAMFPSLEVLRWLYALWGMSTILLFWAPLIKATREWGGAGFQGRAFGSLEGGRGLTAALIGTLALVVFSNLMPDSDLMNASEVRNRSFTKVINITSCLVLISGLLVYLVVPGVIREDERLEKMPGMKNVISLLSEKVIWLQAGIIICAYVGYKITDDFSLYANQVLGFSEVDAAGVGTTALWLRPVFALIAGVIADRFGGIRIMILCFALMLAGGLLVFTGLFSHSVIFTLMILVATVAGVYGIRGIYFSVMKSSGIPLVATGTAVGIMSVVGYTPDIFMSPLMGFLLDNNPGETGHRYVFMVLCIFSAAGFIISTVFKNLMKSKKSDHGPSHGVKDLFTAGRK